MLADERAIGHHERVPRTVGDAYVRLMYASNRRPFMSAIVQFPIFVLIWWFLTRDLISGVILGVVLAFVTTLIRRSDYGQRHFAQWADKHPYPSS